MYWNHTTWVLASVPLHPIDVAYTVARNCVINLLKGLGLRHGRAEANTRAIRLNRGWVNTRILKRQMGGRNRKLCPTPKPPCFRRGEELLGFEALYLTADMSWVFTRIESFHRTDPRPARGQAVPKL